MESPKKQAANILRNKKTQRRWLAVIVCLAMLVTTGTVTALKLNGQAMNRDASTLTCNFVPHTHTDECYDAEGNLVCGQADFVVHTHNADCMTNGELTCTLPEIAAHTHTEDCYTLERVLTCGLEESEPVAPHTHTDECYVDVRPLVCGLEEHTHTDACYTLTEGEKVLTCGQAETDGSEGHTHTDACYTVTPGAPVLTCTEDHEHTDACYAPGEDVRTLTCGLEESPAVPAHHHTEDCYTAETVSTLTCDKPEHTHTDTCYGEPTDERELICTLPEGEGSEGHTHTDECYTEEKVLTCTLPALHTHDGSCYDANGKLVCGMLQLVEHVHTPECFTTNNDVQLAAATRQLVYEDANLRLTADFTTDTYLYDTTALCLVDAETPVPTTPNPAPVTEKVELSIEDPAPVETPAAEPAEETPAEQPVAETPVEEPVAEQPVAETPVEEPVAEQPVDETPAEEPVAEQPADETPVEEPVDEEPVDETPVEEPVDEEPVDEEAPEETPAEAPVTETPAVTPVETPETDETLVRPAMMAGAEQLPAAPVTYTLQYLGSKGQEIGDPVVFQWNPGDAYPTFAPATPLLTQTVVGEDFVVTATYTAEADLPEGAELRASHITDEATVAAYLARYRETLGSEKAAMQMLLDIGFWTGETEVQPAAPVNITLQMLGEDGLPAGEALLIVHFPSDTEAELLPAQVDESNSTAIFDVDGFSPFGVGVAEVPEDGYIRLDNTFEWWPDAEHPENSLYHVTFHVTGTAWPEGSEPPADLDNSMTDDGFVEDGIGDGFVEDDTEQEIVGEETGEETVEDVTGEEIVEDGIADDTVTNDAADSETAAANEGGSATAVSQSQLRWEVQLVDPTDALYQQYQDYVDQTPAALQSMQVVRYSLYLVTADGEQKMDLSNCTITVEVTPTAALEQDAKEADASKDVTLDMSDGTYSVAPEAVQDASGLVVKMATSQTLAAAAELQAVEESLAPADGDEEPVELDPEMQEILDQMRDAADYDIQLQVGEETSASTEIAPRMAAATFAADDGIAPQDNDNLSFIISGQANPPFTVAYFANIPVLHPQDLETVPAYNKNRGSSIPVINLSNGGNNTGGKVMKNNATFAADSNPPAANGLFQSLALTGGQNGGTVSTTYEEQPVYRSRNCTYFRQPGLTYFDALADNGGYDIVRIDVKHGNQTTQIPVKREGTEYISTHDNLPIRFSNRLNGVQKEEDTASAARYRFVKIEENDTITLVYNCNTVNFDTAANFFDYDITNNGYVTTSRNKNGVVNAYGINSTSNYTGNGTAKYAFGNANAGVWYYADTWAKDGRTNFINRRNRSNYQSGSYQDNGVFGCTFGMVTGMNSDGSLIFDSNIQAINGLFSTSLSTKGKHIYAGSDNTKLTFSQVGDTYTLTTATINGTPVARNLQSFNHPKAGNTTHTHIWTNNFWPMDTLTNNDPLVGKLDAKGTWSGREETAFKKPFTTVISGPHNYPASDDGQAHNAFFGMNFSIDFNLDKEYIGPLEYYFFGDDDLWVFLEYPDGKVPAGRSKYQLVCDLGGIHSSVGAHVDLWDWIQRYDRTEDNSYTLHFYYTERGDSGSTCWMQFTLPSVTGATRHEEGHGSLSVSKDVEEIVVDGMKTTTLTGDEIDTNEIFLFKLNLKNTMGNDFTCEKVVIDKDGSIRTVSRLMLHDDNYFTLRKGESLEITNLPYGTEYTLTEVGAISAEYLKDRDYATGEFLNGQDLPLSQKYVYEMLVNGNPCESNTCSGTISKVNQHVQLKVVNRYNAYNLPKTGGEGVTVYYVGGAVLVLAAAGIWFDRRRRKVRS